MLSYLLSRDLILMKQKRFEDSIYFPGKHRGIKFELNIKNRLSIEISYQLIKNYTVQLV